MPKGGVTSEERVFLVKYRFCETLGSGRSGTVYLAWHMELGRISGGENRAENHRRLDTFRKESAVFKDASASGDPAGVRSGRGRDLQLSYRRISKRRIFIRHGETPRRSAGENGGALFGIQICRLIQFMNSAENPILYLDLQPKNLLVNEGSVPPDRF